MRLTQAIIFLAGLTAIPLPAAFGQTGTPSPKFETASVKAEVPGPGGAMLRIMSGGPGTADPGQISYLGVTLKTVLIQAYGAKGSEISGPDWLDTQRYDIVAKMPSATTRPQFLLMLQNLLAERFKMKVHREKKELSIYALTIAQGGPKLKQSAAVAGTGASGGASKTSANGLFRLTATGESMSQFAEVLAGELGRPVIDKTELKGTYDFVLEWPLDETAAAMPSALQAQLGLKLESQESLVELLIVDHAEKIPTEN